MDVNTIRAHLLGYLKPYHAGAKDYAHGGTVEPADMVAVAKGIVRNNPEIAKSPWCTVEQAIDDAITTLYYGEGE